MTSSCSSPRLLVASSKADIPSVLNASIVSIAQTALKERRSFSIALSGGSLTGFLSTLPEAFASAGVDPQWKNWHVLLADERCVPESSSDSNLGAIQHDFLNRTEIPSNQVYGIDQSLVKEGENYDEMDTAAIAKDYEQKLLLVLGGKDDNSTSSSNDKNILNNWKEPLLLDLAVLGFGPDGHTCSLFPGHDLLKESNSWVAAVDDSPKDPPKRITLTLPVLNQNTRHVIFCGAGESKRPIVQAVFDGFEAPKEAGETSFAPATTSAKVYQVHLTTPPPYPCGMVRPLESLTWIVDSTAMTTND